MTIGGPFLAGYLADNHGVRSVFWFVFAASALGGLLTLLLVPETPVRVKARIDWLGAVLLAGGLGGRAAGSHAGPDLAVGRRPDARRA